MSIFYPERFFLHLGGGVWVLFVCFARKNYPWRAARSVCYTHGVWTVCNPIHKMHVFGFFLVFLGRGGGGGLVLEEGWFVLKVLAHTSTNYFLRFW